MDCLSSANSNTPDTNSLEIIRSQVEKEIMEQDAVSGFEFVHAMKNYWNVQKAFAREVYHKSQNFLGYMPFRYCNFGGP
jgi:hypothetical protein